MYEFYIVCVLTHYFSSSTRLSKMIHTKENNANTLTNTNYFLKVFYVSLCVCYTIYTFTCMWADMYMYLNVEAQMIPSVVVSCLLYLLGN